VQVPGEQAIGGGLLLRLGFFSASAFGGVDADEVMELVLIPSGFLKQVPAGQGLQKESRFGNLRVEQGCGRRGTDVLAG
jgi:hypothetical protein